MFEHKHPYPPFIPKNATKLIVGTLPPPRFYRGKLKNGDVNFSYGSIDGLLWKVLNQIYSLQLDFETTDQAIRQRKKFLSERKIGICDIVRSCHRKKIDASDLGMENIVLRDMLFYLNKYPKIHTLLLTGGNSKNGPEYHLRGLLKKEGITLFLKSELTPKIHEFELQGNRKIKVVSLIAPFGSANRAIGSNLDYKVMKMKNPLFNTFDYRVLQYQRFF